ncbi:hypothetical protein Vadar_014595 [Vaccinium darrowii]|uniref:Uncharacterized protein n=1 Tax=Vaccinium darrowii TaxID=229202 RepID=A0ACB7ZKD4_9ERIC|nr:hypothetical protein Vadar_014595 [Vaccinium darrowii]
MAVRFCSAAAPSLIIQNSMPIKKPVNRVFMVTHSHISVKKISHLQILSSSVRNKIFEDRSRGIVCYKDDTGEITCEGYDEGPRPASNYHLSDAEIIDLLVQIFEGGELKVDAGGKGLNLNGNTFC